MIAEITKENELWRKIETEKIEELADWLAESWIESEKHRNVEYCHNPNEFYQIRDMKENVDLKILTPSHDEIVEKLSNQNWGDYSLQIR